MSSTHRCRQGMAGRLWITCVLLAASSPVLAAKDCAELKSEIAAKIDARGVANYRLAIVPTADVGTAQVVGSCEGGSKKITYEKGPAAAAPAPGATNPSK